MTKYFYLCVYPRRYMPCYICIILSDELFTNTEYRYNFKRIQCTRRQCPSWQYGCHIATPSTLSVKTQTEPVIISPMRYFINAAINIDDIVVPLNIHHDHGYAKLSSLIMAFQSMWMTFRMSQSHCRRLQIILSATVRRKRMMQHMGSG